MLSKKSWNPYVVGTLIGLLAISTFYTADRPMGFAMAFIKVTALIEKAFAPEYVKNSAFMNQVFSSEYLSSSANWQLLLLFGVLLGAFISSRMSGDRKIEYIQPVWERRFGNSKVTRLTVSYISGILLFLGTYIAGGCTMAHGINGSMQLALSGWTFFMTVFASGIITSMIVYRMGK